MGVPGLWEFLDENNIGEDICISKLAERLYEEKRRRLRVAIDGNLWSFKNRGGKGGKYPERRTFYYKLNKLMGLGIDAVFVFDGPQKPEFKRNKLVSTVQPKEVTEMSELCKHFGFEVLIAPGEAEAECAHLQRHGLVDYVMTDDVDSLMFGSSYVLKGWKPYHNGSPAAVSVTLYSLKQIEEKLRLTRAGMVLIAMMSGGDYNPAGVVRCGPKTAIEIGQAGYGESLIKCDFQKDKINDWKEKLIESLRNNKSGEFRNRHRAINLSEDFPQKDLFNSYFNPIVSKRTDHFCWDNHLNMFGIQQFVATYMKLDYHRFAIKISPSLAIRKLTRLENFPTLNAGKARVHSSTGGILEVRVSIVPAEVLGADRSREAFDKSSLVSRSDRSDTESATDESESSKLASNVIHIWIPHYIANTSKQIQDQIIQWQKNELAPKSKAKKAGAIQKTTLDSFLVKSSEKMKFDNQENARPTRFSALQQEDFPSALNSTAEKYRSKSETLCQSQRNKKMHTEVLSLSKCEENSILPSAGGRGSRQPTARDSFFPKCLAKPMTDLGHFSSSPSEIICLASSSPMSSPLSQNTARGNHLPRSLIDIYGIGDKQDVIEVTSSDDDRES
ncbi:PIN domain-like protein [Lipomyces chichibuensis]|uniref:PIN domain-like protein n=1 Tax=Lipomyces chichibuensis TaxID=1546026 RepID=UPI003343A5AB